MHVQTIAGERQGERALMALLLLLLLLQLLLPLPLLQAYPHAARSRTSSIGHVLCDRTPGLGGPTVRQEATCVAAASGPCR